MRESRDAAGLKEVHFEAGGETKGSVSGVQMVLHSVTFAVDEDGLGMMQETIQDGRSEGAVVVEDLRPVSECTV